MARILGLILMVLLGVSQARAEDPQSVLEKYIAWRGGTAFQTLQSIHEQGTVEQGGLRGPFEHWLVADGRERRNATLGSVEISQALSANSGWRTNTSGQCEDLGEDATRARRAVLLAFGGVGKANDAQYSMLADEQREGKTWSVVRVRFDDPDTYDLFIAPGTGELLGERVTQDRETRFVRYSDWRFVNGVRLPFTEVNTGTSDADRQVQRARRIQINTPVADALFARPAGTRIWAFAPGQSSTGWIDFEYFQNERIFIPATINGQPVKLLLDSGAGITTVDSAYARQIKLEARGKLPVTGTGGQATMQLARNLSIQVGSLTLQHLTAGIIDLSQTAAALGHPMPLVLGAEAFSQLIVDIDFPHRRLALRDPSQFAAPPEAARVPLGHHGDQRTVSLAIEDGPVVPFDFDLGSNSPLIVFSAYSDAHHVLEGRRHSLRLIGGVGGLTQTKVATVKSLSIAGAKLLDIPAQFPEVADSAVSSDRVAGNVGLPVFNRFRLIADYPHDALWLSAAPELLSRPFPRDRSGLVAFPAPDHLQVLMVSPGSPAERAGWEKGAEIVAIDGHRIDAQYGKSSWARWAQQPAGTLVTLTLRDGSARQLTLEDYF